MGGRSKSRRPRIVTLTANPTIDLSSEAERVGHTHKTRTFNERLDPGGGGINVARVLQRLGNSVEAIFLAGGPTGQALNELLARARLARSCFGIAGDTRMSLAVHERATGFEYRFVPEGPVVSEGEWSALIEALHLVECDYFVASGSLPRGLPTDFYARARAAVGSSSRFVLDTSGPALRETLQAGEVFLVKPSRGELENLVGKQLSRREEFVEAAREFVTRGQVEHMVVTFGHEGALLVNREGSRFLPAVPVEARSAVGAGDSFVAAMVHGFARGLDGVSAARLGVAAGAAAVLTPGSDLCHRKDLERLITQNSN